MKTPKKEKDSFGMQLIKDIIIIAFGLAAIWSALTVIDVAFAVPINNYAGLNLTDFNATLSLYNTTGIEYINVYNCSVNSARWGYWMPMTEKTSKIYLYFCEDNKYSWEWILEHELKHHKCWLNNRNGCRLWDNIHHTDKFEGQEVRF